MAITVEAGEDRSDLGLEGVVDIAQAAELKERLVEALERGTEVRVSLGGVTDMDVTALQLLWAARRAAEAAGIRFAWEGPVPETVSRVLADAGFQRF